MFGKLTTAFAGLAASALAMEENFLQTPETQELGVISTGTYPCVFQLGDSFFDFTPFKLAFASPMAVMYDITDPTVMPTSFIYSWCQQLSDIQDTTFEPKACGNLAVFAARTPYLTIEEPDTVCTAQSSGDSDDINAESITGMPNMPKLPINV